MILKEIFEDVITHLPFNFWVDTNTNRIINSSNDEHMITIHDYLDIPKHLKTGYEILNYAAEHGFVRGGKERNEAIFLQGDSDSIWKAARYIYKYYPYETLLMDSFLETINSSSFIKLEEPELGYWIKTGKFMPRDRRRIYEGTNRNLIVVDVQPEYSGINDGDYNPVFEDIMHFVEKHKGKTLFLYNGEELTNDTEDSIRYFWEEEQPDISWDRFEFYDKGYGYLRSWMDSGISNRVIIKTIRELYLKNLIMSNELDSEFFEQFNLSEYDLDIINTDPISIGWIPIDILKRYNHSYLIGGGREECLKEVELILNAFNIKYKRIDHLIY